MVVLSDVDIKKYLSEGRLLIKDHLPECISMASVDLHLSPHFKMYKYNDLTHIDTREGVKDHYMHSFIIEEGNSIVIHPGELVLGSTREYVKLPYDLVGRLDGRSSLARLGLVIHSTAGSIDPGFEGNITLEIVNIAKVPIKLWPGSRICRITFDKLSTPTSTPYDKRPGSKYLKAVGPGTSKIGID